MTSMKLKRIWWIHTLFAPRRVIYILIFTLFLIKAIGTLDPDFGWHLRSGEYILANGVPARDIFTYTAGDFPWIHHEWLADVLSAIIYPLGGYWLLGAVFASLWTAAIWLVSRNSPLPLVALVATCAMMSFSGVRAVTWTVFFCAVLYSLLQRRGRIRWWIPLLMICWANMHGGFVLGLAYIGWRTLAERSPTLLGVFIGSVLMTFLTPYGPGVYLEVWRTLADRELHANIQEWNSFALTIPAIAIIGVWAGMRATLISPWWRVIVSFETLLLVATISSIRSLPLFCLFALGWVSVVLAKISVTRDTVIKIFSPIQGIVSVVTAAVIIVMAAGVYDALRGARLDPDTRQPQRIIQALRDRPCEGRLFNSYNIGGYLIWKLPNTPVYIDGRMPSWEHDGKKYISIYKEVLANADIQKREFLKYDIRCVAIEARSDLAKRLQRDGWRREVVDNGYVLFRRSTV